MTDNDYQPIFELMTISQRGLLKELNGPYMILDMMQVSAETRGHGVGKQLFNIGKEAARRAGADSPIQEIAETEPFDLQMVCSVNPMPE